jgi:DNA invertase Pin-like site-specific DNA recombinase
MKPLIYGYLRVDDTARDGDVIQMELALRDFAEREGYAVADIFREDQDGDRRAFLELIEALKASESRHVITPAPELISPHPLVRRTLLDQLAEEAGTRVISLRDSVEGTVHHDRNSNEEPPARG